MNFQRATKRLLGLFITLLVLDLFGIMRPVKDETLPELAAFVAAEVTQISLSQGDVRIVLERTGQRTFSLVSPISQPADFGRVNAITSTLYAGVQMAVRVDQGNLEQYGLAGQSAIAVSLAGADVALSFVVGSDSAGGTTFVRFSNDDVVYRARIGGRHKYEGSPSSWRNHMVVDRSAESVHQLQLQNPQGSFIDFTRSEQGVDATGKIGFTPWRWSQKDLVVDQVAVNELLRSLVTLRAGDLLSVDQLDGLGEPKAVVRLELEPKETITLAFYRSESGTFVKRADQEIVYRIANSVINPLLRTTASWQERTLMAFEPAELSTMVLRDTRMTTRIQRDPATGELQITAPQGMDTDRRAALFAVRKLSAFRAESLVDIAPQSAGFDTGTTVSVTLTNQRTQTIQIGSSVPQSAIPKLYVRSLSQPDRVGVVDAALVARMFKAWSR